MMVFNPKKTFFKIDMKPNYRLFYKKKKSIIDSISLLKTFFKFRINVLKFKTFVLLYL